MEMTQRYEYRNHHISKYSHGTHLLFRCRKWWPTSWTNWTIWVQCNQHNQMSVSLVFSSVCEAQFVTKTELIVSDAIVGRWLGCQGSLHMNENELPVHNNHTIDIYGHVAFTGQLWAISNPFFRLYDSNNIASSSYTAIIYNVYVPMWIWITFFDIIRPDASMYYYSKLLSEIYMEMFNFPSTKAYTTREE